MLCILTNQLVNMIREIICWIMLECPLLGRQGLKGELLVIKTGIYHTILLLEEWVLRTKIHRI